MSKIKEFFNNINWVRVRFVLLHAVVAGVVTGLAHLVYLVFGAFGVSVFAGLVWLVGKEFGEIAGKRKAAGTFENDFNGNKEVFLQAIGSVWQLWQTVGAVAVFLLACLIFKVLF